MTDIKHLIGQLPVADYLILARGLDPQEFANLLAKLDRYKTWKLGRPGNVPLILVFDAETINQTNFAREQVMKYCIAALAIYNDDSSILCLWKEGEFHTFADNSEYGKYVPDILTYENVFINNIGKPFL